MRVVLIAVMLAGCATVAEEPVADGRCDAAPVQDLIGRAADTVLLDAEKRSGSGMVRVHATGDAVTMDYRADRLNLEVDAANRIIAVKCG